MWCLGWFFLSRGGWGWVWFVGWVGGGGGGVVLGLFCFVVVGGGGGGLGLWWGGYGVSAPPKLPGRVDFL